MDHSRDGGSLPALSTLPSSLPPPLCLPAACKQEEQSGLEDIDRLTQGPDYRMGFAVVELWEKACALLRKNA